MPAETPPRRKRAAGHSQAEVVAAIRRAILANELPPGHRLIEADLCAALGASRGTVRAALADLVYEGLVEHIANRGARVRVVGLDEALQLADVRRAVETLCVRRAAEVISDAGIAELRALSDGLPALAAAQDVAGFAQTTQKIFRIYVAIADLPVAKEMLDRVRDRLTGHRLRLTFRPERARISLPYWQEIVAAICARDPARAEKALWDHVENVKGHMRSVSQAETPLARLGRPTAAAR